LNRFGNLYTLAGNAFDLGNRFFITRLRGHVETNAPFWREDAPPNEILASIQKDIRMLERLPG
jgi:hypothetical protein